MQIDRMEDILAKLVSGEATNDEMSMAEAWSKESLENKIIYDDYLTVWSATGSYQASEFVPNTDKAYERHLSLLVSEEEQAEPMIPQKPTTVISLGWKKWTSIAAVFVAALSAVFLLRSDATTITANEGIQYVSLADGSQIWLDEGSSISYDSDFNKNERKIELSGKAFFDVARNESKPFIIEEKDLSVSVLGTSFTVDGMSDRVDVVSGKVQVSSPTSEVIVTKGESSILDGEQLEIGSVEEGHAKWRNPNLSFDNAPLSQVVADLNLFYGDQLTLISEGSANECAFTSSGLVSESLENTVKILEAAYDVTVVKSGDRYELTIMDCQ